jgi:ubiquinone/menaquinone biosynthesis C-methylase UbiE
MLKKAKNWDSHVVAVEEVARTVGLRRIRDRIVALAEPGSDDVAVDVGAGTGLLSLALAPLVRTVWAIDISPAMTDYARVKAASAGLHNVEHVTASALSLPVVDGAASLLVSNYCYHHLRDGDKERALAEAFRVLRPHGRIVIGDMMFRMQLRDRRNRRLITWKVRKILARGPAGVVRLLKNALRLLSRKWEQPADGEWWRAALRRAGFEQIEVQLLEGEGGIVAARRPASAAPLSRYADLARVAA